MTSFIPLVSMIILFAIIYGIIRVGRSVTSKIHLDINVKWVVAGYLILLLVSMIVYEVFLPKQDQNPVKANEVVKNNQKMYEAALSGNIEKINSDYIVRESQFKLKGQKLKIRMEENEFYDGSIVIERKRSDDGLIETMLFRNPAAIAGMESLKSVTPLGIDMRDSTLFLATPSPLTITYYKFKKEFTISQFTDNELPLEYMGTSLLYIRIPRNVDIENKSDLYLEYTGM